MDNKFNPYQENPFDGTTNNSNTLDPYYSQQMLYQQQMQHQQLPSNNLSENNMNYMMSHNGKQNEQPSSNMGLHQPQLHQPYERSVERPHSNEHHIPMPSYSIPPGQQQQQITGMYQHPPQSQPMPSGGGHLMPAAPLDYHMQVPNNELNVLAQKPEMNYQPPQHQFQPPVENLHATQMPNYDKPYEAQLGQTEQQQIHYMGSQIQPDLPAQQPTPMQIQIANKWSDPPTCPKKKRRRIVQENEEDSDDNELTRATLNKSPTPQIAESTNKNELEVIASENSGGEDICMLKDPQAIKEHQARNLLKGAVIIQAASDKKKKIRVLDSDDEQEQTNVDDIGMESNDANFDEQGDENSEERVVPIENPIIPQDEEPEVPTTDEATTADIKKEHAENKSLNEESESTEVEKEKALSENENEEHGLVPAMKVEAVLEKEDDDKGDDDANIPNDIYFGTPDKTVPVVQAPKKRGRKPGTVMNPYRKKSNKYEKETYSDSSESSSDATFSEDSYSSSSGATSDEDSRRKKPVYRSPVPGRPKFTYANVPQLMRKVSAPVVSRSSKPQPKKKDRFYDKSRDIPNDVYFGDVKVPLHVLHTRWASDASADSSSESSSESDHYTYAKGKTGSGAPRGRPPNSARKNIPMMVHDINDDPRLAQMKTFLKVAGIKANYPRLFEGIQSVDDKCTILRRILAQKGMQGEVTIAKCRQLKLDLQVKRENQELDTSVIIAAEGRTRRSVGTRSTNKVSNKRDDIQPETLQTLSKMKRIVDSDSE